MSRVALELGETSIDRAKITPTPDGGYRMQWSMRLLNGRLIKKTTKGKCTKGELRRRAHAQAEEILATGGGSTPWKGSSSMRDYIRKEVIPGIERTDDSILRPRTRDKYCQCSISRRRRLGAFASRTRFARATSKASWRGWQGATAPLPPSIAKRR